MKEYIYGVDLGGTTVKIGLFKLDGTKLDNFEIKTNTEENGLYILRDIALAIKDNIKNNYLENKVKGIGIGVPGPVTNGVVNRCVNLGWGVVNVKQELEALTNLPVSVSNDANVASLGELWMGGGSGFSNLVFITLGTGVGGGVVVDGKIIDGSVGAGGEIGHAKILHSDFLCNCGNIGCLETVASATGVVRVAQKYLSEENTPSILRNKEITAKDVFDAAKVNDEIGKKTIEYFGKSLGYICSIIAVTNNPEVFVFGGGVSKAGTIVIDVIKKYFRSYAFFALKDSTIFKLAELGNDAGIYGAAYLALKM